MSSQNYTAQEPIGAFSSLQTYLTYSWINNESFYALIPAPYTDFYNRFIKHWCYWFDGYVPYFHNSQSGMVSTNLAYAIIKKLAEKTVGSHLMYDDEGEKDEHEIKVDGKNLNSLNFIEYWTHKNEFTSLMDLGFQFAYGIGDSLLKLNCDGKDLYPTVQRKDTYLIDTDFKGEINHYKGLIYSYSKMIPSSENKERKQYYLVEEREYVDGKPKYRLGINVNQGTSTNNKSTDMTIEDVPYDRLPNDIKRKFKRDYPNINLGEWQDIPLEDLGIYQIKATKGVHFLPDLPAGESLLSPLIGYLMTYDFYFSSLTTNLYTTRDKVIVPEHMTTPQDGVVNNGQIYNSGLDGYLYNRIRYVSPEDQSPIFIQPELRDWQQIRNNLLQSIAMNLGVDERTILSSIVPNAEKPTAREISVDEDTTASFIENKRELNRNAINKMLRQVLRFYGFKTEEVTVRFSKSGLSNINNVVTVATLLKQNGLGDVKTLLQMVYVDKNEKQIENILEALKKEKEEDFKREQTKKEQTQGVEENIEQMNNQSEYHVPKPNRKEDK